MSVDDMAPLVAGTAALGVKLDDEQLARFVRYRELLLDWNTRINLTAITDPVEVVTRHFLDSLTCALALPADERGDRSRLRTLLDVGSGAGFPGLALAIAFPRWRITLLEATGKKVRFLETVITELGLTHARALAGRAEEVARQRDQRGHYALVVARGLSALPTLLEYCAPFARVGGLIIAPKKGDLAGEIAAGTRAAAQLGAQLRDPITITLPALADGRVLLVAQQQRPCPPTYPRAGGAPLKHPLGEAV
ncbi:MAG TPA: 16S rRNA (guanine(527)-N(7))-methyltransferase RsmG [Ktedonobacterales bacterium]|nr:16S rRNA (guanine(527)-N(7))-methyltransferase RsmG [Ktedonobacterales bacterium]